MFGADPNWGRIIARLGSLNNINYSPEKVDLHINKMLIFTDGVQSNECNLKLLNKSMKKKEVVIDIALNCGSSDHSVITSDLSHEYVHINSAYTT
jgi:glutamate N-acetyltransferase/amino-acid N-acetyltransferase